MSVQTGIAPHELLELDGDMYDALERAVAERWDVHTEVDALSLELLVQVYGSKSSRGITVPRPAWWSGSEEAEAVTAMPAVVVSPHELAEMVGKEITYGG